MMVNRWNWQLSAVVIAILMIAQIKPATSKQSDAPKSDGPIISPNQKELILQKGQNFTISCKGKKPLELKQQELPEEMFGPFTLTGRNVTSIDVDYEYEVALDLYNVDSYAVGYYVCFDDTINGIDVLNNIVEEPVDTDHVSYIYIYVNGTDTLFAPMREIVVTRSGSKVVIECKPTTPDVNITLIGVDPEIELDEAYDSKVGFVFDSNTLDYYPTVYIIMFDCCAQTHIGHKECKDIYVHKNTNVLPPKPSIRRTPRYFLRGETFSLTCTAPYQNNYPVVLIWHSPSNKGAYNMDSTNVDIGWKNKVVFNTTIITDATIEDAGNYTCTSKNSNGVLYDMVSKTFLERGYVNLTTANNLSKETRVIKQRVARVSFIISAYPKPNITLYINNVTLEDYLNKYEIIMDDAVSSIKLTIRRLGPSDTANYTVVASNGFETASATYEIFVQSSPFVKFKSGIRKQFMVNSIASFSCEAIGFNLPNIQWIFTDDVDNVTIQGNTVIESLNKVKSTLDIPVKRSGNLTCEASNEISRTLSLPLRLDAIEIPNGFGIVNSSQTWFAQNQDVKFECVGSIYKIGNVSWLRNHDEYLDEPVEYYNTALSHIARLKLSKISLDQAGLYSCFGHKTDGSSVSEQITITVAANEPPEIRDSEIDKDVEIHAFLPAELSCLATGIPAPKVEWYKDGELLVNYYDDITIKTLALNKTTINSTVMMKQMDEKYKGKYECVATSNNGTARKFFNLSVKETTGFRRSYYSIIGVILFILVGLIILSIYLWCKVRKEKQFRKELAAAGLLNFKEGQTRSLNPELGIGEQAELLPYDEKFEFPKEKIKLGKQLGAGAFGVVYKALARGIINAEEETPVAVKMVKKNADNMHIKALASELKIMVHLGKHINIVNLLGACTQNVEKRELIVIVEYCEFGNIHSYMQKHREVFIDQLTDYKDKSGGKVNRAFSSSNNSAGLTSDYSAFCETPTTDHTMVHTGNTSTSKCSKKGTGYVQGDWQQGDIDSIYYDRSIKLPLCSRDLLMWAFQIARGMEYLAKRKVLHGDLAARNILLAKDNIVKICDFGLARNMHYNDEYLKSENSPLPVKWLAIECMTDRLFSTQSDVWSFGIVLWELFSLAKTPYPNVDHTQLLQFLTDGRRLEKPPYANDPLYDVMCQCWKKKPTERPSFTEIQELLGNFLEESERQHYMDLNCAYDTNCKVEGEKDYLAMVCAPDYNNMVTPSPHNYVNGTSFFPSSPSHLAHDSDGYLQMTPVSHQVIFTPNKHGSRFDFETQRLHSKNSDSELTPMLIADRHLIVRGSESDHDGRVSMLPKYPQITEENEDNEVFETKQHIVKNLENGSAVSNPTYAITINLEDNKSKDCKPNLYANTDAPKVLVN